jgi:hypothetical protein
MRVAKVPPGPYSVDALPDRRPVESVGTPDPVQRISEPSCRPLCELILPVPAVEHGCRNALYPLRDESRDRPGVLSARKENANLLLPVEPLLDRRLYLPPETRSPFARINVVVDIVRLPRLIVDMYVVPLLVKRAHRSGRQSPNALEPRERVADRPIDKIVRDRHLVDRRKSRSASNPMNLRSHGQSLGTSSPVDRNAASSIGDNLKRIRASNYYGERSIRVEGILSEHAAVSRGESVRRSKRPEQRSGRERDAGFCGETLEIAGRAPTELPASNALRSIFPPTAYLT